MTTTNGVVYSKNNHLWSGMAIADVQNAVNAKTYKSEKAHDKAMDKAIIRFQKADKNNDGVLSIEEIKQYDKDVRNKKIRNTLIGIGVATAVIGGVLWGKNLINKNKNLVQQLAEETKTNNDKINRLKMEYETLFQKDIPRSLSQDADELMSQNFKWENGYIPKGYTTSRVTTDLDAGYCLTDSTRPLGLKLDLLRSKGYEISVKGSDYRAPIITEMTVSKNGSSEVITGGAKGIETWVNKILQQIS